MFSCFIGQWEIKYLSEYKFILSNEIPEYQLFQELRWCGGVPSYVFCAIESFLIAL